MSTSETTIFNKGQCPCGQGHIAHHVTTQDNPWSTADISYSIECPRCFTEWRVDGGTLMLRSSEVGYQTAAQAQEAAAKPLRELVRRIVAHEFSRFSAPTKKAEHQELVRLELTNMSYAQYLKHRRSGGTVVSAAMAARNPEWLSSSAGRHGLATELETLTAAHNAAKQAVREAHSQVVRRKVS